MKFNKLYRTVLLASLAISPLVLSQQPVHADQTAQSANQQASSTNSSTNTTTSTSSATSSTSTPSSSSTATSASHASSKQSSTSTVASTPNSASSSSSSSKPAPAPKPSNSQADWKKLPNRLSKAAVRRLVRACGIKYRKLSKNQLAALRKINLHSKRPRSGRRLTYKNMADIATALINGNKRYWIPYFKANKIENLNSAYTVDAQDAPNGPKSKLDIWDSWAVQNPKDGTVTNWNGYQLVIAMMGKADPGANSNHLYLMYNKYGDKNY
ncbi:MAG: glycoside hydrolase family 68 protein [Lactobacillus sp.]